MLSNYLLVKELSRSSSEEGNNLFTPITLVRDTSQISDYDPLFISKYFCQIPTLDDITLENRGLFDKSPCMDNGCSLNNALLIKSNDLNEITRFEIPVTTIQYSQRTPSSKLKKSVRRHIEKVLTSQARKISINYESARVLSIDLEILLRINTPSHVVAYPTPRLRVSPFEENAYLRGQIGVYRLK